MSSIERGTVAQSVRQIARQRALETQKLRRSEQKILDKRRSAIGVRIAVALEERDAAVGRHEAVAGEALTELTREVGVRIADVENWVPGVTAAEARRLMRSAEVMELS
ncbi:hypothetical protein [Aeromicrobium sp. Root495]|uniref:hypothetical protein n=1 Tax=Aeromicrobium sp. Root495 TaxID=1736550 RepID=UPI001F4238FD|nr:hypothetical protein [Aeromicrobium sp. Root495]